MRFCPPYGISQEARADAGGRRRPSSPAASAIRPFRWIWRRRQPPR